jgi:hypothetical protein
MTSFNCPVKPKILYLVGMIQAIQQEEPLHSTLPVPRKLTQPPESIKRVEGWRQE